MKHLQPIIAGVAILLVVALTACSGYATPAATTAATTAATEMMGTPTTAGMDPTTAAATDTMGGSQSGSGPATVMTATNDKLGSILVDAKGMTLYTFGKDTPNQSACIDACAKLWPALTVPAGTTPTAPPNFGGMLGTIQRADGTTQVTIDKMPLYTFAQDTKPGDVNGQNYIDLWWVVPTDVGAGAPDFSQHGFPNVLASQKIMPGKEITITADAYTVTIPADAFVIPVTFDILGADPASFSAKAPTGETPVLAFAFRVQNTRMTSMIIGKFNQPVMLDASSPQITAGSKYYNVATDGTFTDNPKGLKVEAGKLSHPIAGAGVGWVITSPAK